MTTTIPSIAGCTPATIEPSGFRSGGLFVKVGTQFCHIPREDLAAELGVLTIDKADLPEVEQSGVLDVQFKIDGVEFQDTTDPKIHREAALRHLALAEYLEAHPPVDEQQVEALAMILWTSAQTASGPGDDWDEATDADRNRFRNKAGRVLATGKVTVQP